MNGDLAEGQTSPVSITESDRFEGSPNIITRVIHQKKLDKVCLVLAEFIGTASLLFFGCAGTIHWTGPPISFLPPMNFGLTVMMIIQTFGHVSFALLNPAVNIAAVVYKQISLTMGIVLTLAQVVGAVVGFGLLKFLTPQDIYDADAGGTCMTVLHPSMSVTAAFFMEFFLTFGLVCTVCGSWDPRNRLNTDSTPIRIGLTVFGLSVAGAPFTVASMNPVRSLGPALWNWNWSNHWLYWVAPLLGGFVASNFYRIVFWRKNPPDTVQDTVPLSFASKREC